MSLKYALLGVLEVGPMSGYELTQFLEGSARWVWSAPQSQIYPLLKKLEAEGLISGERTLKGTRLAVTHYSITDAGAEDLRAWLAEPHPMPATRDPFLLQALFGDLLPYEKSAEVFEAHIEELTGLIASWRAQYQELVRVDTPLMRERIKRDPESGIRMRAVMGKAHVFQGMVRMGEARVAWARDTLAYIRGAGSLDDPDPTE